MIVHPLKKENVVDQNEILKTILEENREMRKEIKNMKINQTINHNGDNNKFNINIFLNEHCKNAMCLDEFVRNLPLTLQDLARTSRIGFAGGVSNIIVRSLNDLPALERPIHCSDSKRLKFYVKDKEGWNIDISNNKVDSAIDTITAKQISAIKTWEEANPGFMSNEKKMLEWTTLVYKLTGGLNVCAREKENKIIKKKIGDNTGIKDAMLSIRVV